MSADRWSICPRCQDRANAEQARKMTTAIDAYGKVPAKQYLVLLETFREDYAFYGVDEGIIYADYSGHCQECGLNVDFTHKHPFYSSDDA